MNNNKIQSKLKTINIIMESDFQVISRYCKEVVEIQCQPGILTSQLGS